MESTRCEVKMGQICTIQTSWLLCCASVMPICVVSTSLSVISETLWWNIKWGLLQSGICRAVHRVTNLQKNPVRISVQRWSWRAASTQHDTKNWEIHWYPETSANKAKTESLTRMPTAEKTKKERDCTQMPVAKQRKIRPQMPVAKKERPNHKCWWQMKNGCPNQSSKQLTPNERNTETAETTSKSQTVG